MSVAAHPHVGLQTVSWLFEGEVEHRDSVGSNQTIHPGELNLMTAGRGVSHSELSLPGAPIMHGVQLWTVLPNRDRNSAPLFDHYQDLPKFTEGGMTACLFVGEFMGHQSPARTFSELVGVEINLAPGTTIDIPTRTDFEYGALLVQGDLAIDGVEIPLPHLRYTSAGKSSALLTSRSGAKLIILGGIPFPEEIVMWWNFIGRTHEEIMQMRNDWNEKSDRFPHFEDRIRGRIPAPELPNLQLNPRGNVRPATN